MERGVGGVHSTLVLLSARLAVIVEQDHEFRHTGVPLSSLRRRVKVTGAD